MHEWYFCKVLDSSDELLTSNLGQVDLNILYGAADFLNTTVKFPEVKFLSAILDMQIAKNV